MFSGLLFHYITIPIKNAYARNALKTDTTKSEKVSENEQHLTHKA